MIKKRFAASVLRKWEASLPEIEIISAETAGYRVRATFRVQDGCLGFFKAGSRDFVTVEACPVISPSLFAKAIAWAEQTWGDRRLLTLSVMEAPDGRAIALAECDVTGRVYDRQGFSGLMMNGKIAGDSFLSYETPYGVVGVGYGGFFQSNRFLNDKFQEIVVNMAKGAENITELYAGSGFFTAGLMKVAQNTAGYELAGDAVRLAKHFGYPIHEKDAGEALTKAADTLVMDPPREGASKKLMQTVLEKLPRRIIYVSCNPATAARDLFGLKERYHVLRRVMVDMFPHSHHTETIHLLERI
jgi:23S rRNA (uracil1939-C5)-methyltransferase